MAVFDFARSTALFNVGFGAFWTLALFGKSFLKENFGLPLLLRGVADLPPL